jgi:hypothetical protein
VDSSLLRTVVSNQTQQAETQELEHLISKILPISGHLHNTFNCTILALRHHVTYIYLYGTVMALSSVSNIQALRIHGGGCIDIKVIS